MHPIIFFHGMKIMLFAYIIFRSLEVLRYSASSLTCVSYIHNLKVASYYNDLLIQFGITTYKPIIAFFIMMTIIVHVSWLISLVMIWRKDGSPFILASLATIQLIFTFAIMTLSTQQIATYNQSTFFSFFDDVLIWTNVVVAFSWLQVIIMTFNVLHLTILSPNAKAQE